MRVSPKKMKALAHTVVGLVPQDAVSRLMLIAGKRESILAKVIKGAIAKEIVDRFPTVGKIASIIV